jgi:hypothetical protein
MARAAIDTSLRVFVGDSANYGDGGAYWSINKNDNGSLPLTEFAVANAMLDWNMPHETARKVSLVRSNW